MKIHVTCIQEDLLTGERKILSDTSALIDNYRMIYFEEDGKSRQIISFRDDEVILERLSDISSKTMLRKRGKGQSIVDSPFGTMKLETEMKRCEKREDRWLVEYRVFSGSETVLEQRLTWEIEQFH